MQIVESGGTVQVVFRPSGWGRFVVIGFLLFWLCGWGVGEWFALRLVVWSARGGSEAPLAKALEHPAGWLIAGFVLVWLLGWTWGGLAALFEVARLAAGRDVLEVSSDGYALFRGVGPLGIERRFDRGSVRELYVRARTRDLVLEAGAGRHLVTRAMRPEERALVEERFAVAAPDGSLPLLWRAVESGDGGVVIERRRREGAGCLVASVLLFAASAAFVLRFAPELPLAGALLATLVALALGFLVARGLTFRREWLAGPGRLELRTSWLGVERVEPADPRSLRIESSLDGEGDERIALVATVGERRRTLHSDVNESRDVIGLARFLEARTGWGVERDPLPSGGRS